MLKRDDWLDLARKLDWDFSYVVEEDAFPEVQSGRPWLPARRVGRLGRTLPHELRRVRRRPAREGASRRRGARGGRPRRGLQAAAARWLERLKLHAATLPLAEFAAVVGNLRAARFGRDSAWRIDGAARRARRAAPHADPALADARAGALGRAVRLDAQLLSTPTTGSRSRRATSSTSCCSRPTRSSSRSRRTSCSRPASPTCSSSGCRRWPTASATGCSRRWSAASRATRRATPRSARPVLATVVEHDRALRAVPARQVVLAELAAVRGRHRLRDGLPDAARAPHARRSRSSCRSGCSTSSCARSTSYGLQAPVVLGHLPRRRSTTTTTWSTRARTPTARRCGSTSWCPGPHERAWLRSKYPGLVAATSIRSGSASPSAGATPIPATTSPCTARRSSRFCDLCQLVLCERHAARTTPPASLDHGGRSYIFCSEPVPLDLRAASRERYAGHKDVVKRVLAGEAPANLVALVHELLRARLRDLGQGRVRRRLPLAGKRRQDG